MNHEPIGDPTSCTAPGCEEPATHRVVLPWATRRRCLKHAEISRVTAEGLGTVVEVTELERPPSSNVQE